MVRRDTGEKLAVKEQDLENELNKLLDDIQKNMYDQARNFMNENIWQPTDFADLKKTLEEKRGFIKANWCGSSDCENLIKEETGATMRCIPFEEQNPGNCIVCGKKQKA